MGDAQRLYARRPSAPGSSAVPGHGAGLAAFTMLRQESAAEVNLIH